MNIKLISILAALAFVVAPVVSFAEEEIETVDSTEIIEDVMDEWENPEYEDVEVVDNAETTEEVVQARTLSTRLTCKEINQKVDELKQDVKAYPELKPELETMLARQRSQCAARANRRPVHNYENVNPITIIDVEPVQEVAETVEVVEQPVQVESPEEPVKTPEEIAAEQEAEAKKIADNIANGLCGDGTKPNRYGCCEGEKFKEVSQMKFACCPKDGDGECHDPIKKK